MGDHCALHADGLSKGEGLVFLLGAFRGGTTLLRKVLDSHTRIVSPAETWFLLPLLNMWDGHGSAPHFNPRQAGVAIQQHLSQGEFVDACRAFAGSFYASALRKSGKDASVFVDKTPLYLMLAGALPVVFPSARFVVLGRDPRGIAWSRHTWRHIESPKPESQFKGVANDVRTLAAFAKQHADRSLVVQYERVCMETSAAAEQLCEFLGVGHEPSMIEYGSSTHHEGYGDELTLKHARPHAESVARWSDDLTIEQQAKLIGMCGDEALRLLGYEGIEPIVSASRMSA